MGASSPRRMAPAKVDQSGALNDAAENDDFEADCGPSQHAADSDPQTRSHRAEHVADDVPAAVRQHIADAARLVAEGGGCMPCQASGMLHDNTRGALLGFASATRQAKWLETQVASMAVVCSAPKLSSGDWAKLDPTFFGCHWGLVREELPSLSVMKGVLGDLADDQRRLSEEAWKQLDAPAEDLEELVKIPALWPAGTAEELKERCVQPAWCMTMRLNYMFGLTAYEQLCILGGRLCRHVGLDPRSDLRACVKKPFRMRQKAFMRFPAEAANNDYRRSADVYRASVTASTPRQVIEMRQVLESLGEQSTSRMQALETLGMQDCAEHIVVERIKSRFAQGAAALGGYRDLLVNIRISGYVVELQVHLRHMWDVSAEYGPTLHGWFQVGQWDEDSHTVGGNFFQLSFTGSQSCQQEIYFNSGNHYDGEWENGLRHGQGRYLCSSSGDVYEGQFHKGQFHGHGTFRSPAAGEAYEGEFRHGMWHGQGRRTRRDGSAEEGSWWRNKLAQVMLV